jgi:hypothetical protein
MTAEEIVKRLRLQVEYICTYNESGMVGREVSSNVLCNAAADLIERQAKVIDAVEGIIEKIRRETGPDTDARDALDDCVDAIRKLKGEKDV